MRAWDEGAARFDRGRRSRGDSRGARARRGVVVVGLGTLTRKPTNCVFSLYMQYSAPGRLVMLWPRPRPESRDATAPGQGNAVTRNGKRLSTVSPRDRTRNNELLVGARRGRRGRVGPRHRGRAGGRGRAWRLAVARPGARGAGSPHPLQLYSILRALPRSLLFRLAPTRHFFSHFRSGAHADRLIKRQQAPHVGSHVPAALVVEWLLADCRDAWIVAEQ